MVQQMALTNDAVTVLSISDSEWRVSNPRIRQDDALCLLGFVQQVGGVFETTRIARPRERRYYATLQAAIESLAIRDTSAVGFSRNRPDY